MNEIKENSQFNFGYKSSIYIAMLIMVCLMTSGFVINLPASIWPSLRSITLPLSFAVGGFSAYFVLSKYLNFRWDTIREHLLKSPNGMVLFLCVALFFLGLPIAEFLVALFPKDITPFFEQMYKESILVFEKALENKISGFMTICIVAPIVEEILFRGVLLRGLLQSKFTKPLYAILISSIIFGLVHMNPWQFIGAGFLGAIFGYVYYQTKSLWLCIFLHVLNNSISFYYLVKNETMEASITNTSNYLMVVICLIFAILVGWLINKKTTKIKWN